MQQFLSAIALFLAAATCTLASAEDAFPLKAKRILFLGDSITAAGEYVYMIDMQLRLQSTSPAPVIINAGLPSENVTGLSEPDHPFPRPNVHERLDRALNMFKPDVVVACYGMNDGIYYPFSEERFQKYQAGINTLIEKVYAANAKLVLLTPPPFDAAPLKAAGKLLPAGAEKYAWFAVYESYDEVIQKYGKWILEQKDRVEMVVDVYSPSIEFWTEQRKTDPAFTVAADGVHCNSTGHRTLAEAILKAWGITKWVETSSEMTQLSNQQGSVLHDAWLSHIGHKRPGTGVGLPLPEAEAKAAEIEKQLKPLVEKLRASSR
jgi:lysophospholipase L1-like esterase